MLTELRYVRELPPDVPDHDQEPPEVVVPPARHPPLTRGELAAALAWAALLLVLLAAVASYA